MSARPTPHGSIYLPTKTQHMGSNQAISNTGSARYHYREFVYDPLPASPDTGEGPASPPIGETEGGYFPLSPSQRDRGGLFHPSPLAGWNEGGQKI